MRNAGDHRTGPENRRCFALWYKGKSNEKPGTGNGEREWGMKTGNEMENEGPVRLV